MPGWTRSKQLLGHVTTQSTQHESPLMSHYELDHDAYRRTPLIEVC